MQTQISFDETSVSDARDRYETTELLHVSERTRVERVFPSGSDVSVIRKEPLGPGADERLRHEAAIVRRLFGIEGVVQLSTMPPQPRSLSLVDVGGARLSSQPAPMKSPELIDVALRLARAVAAMHRRGVIHRDISPANVVQSASSRTLCLIDFALATTFAETPTGVTSSQRDRRDTRLSGPRTDGPHRPPH